MDLLLNITYTPFDDFYIRVNEIKHGWMELCVGVDDKSSTYAACYIADIIDPLNDLLDVAIWIVNKQRATSFHYDRTSNAVGDYFYVLHDSDGKEVTWLFKYNEAELTLIVWQDAPADWHTLFMLAEENFNSQSVDIQTLERMPDLTKELVFALKSSPVPFIKSLISTFQNLDKLQRHDDDGNNPNWGCYSVDNVNILKELLVIYQQ